MKIRENIFKGLGIGFGIYIKYWLVYTYYVPGAVFKAFIAKSG